ncbi:hypothetical protein PVAND_004784 [Polypedilum vanderplanki]|uniref:FXNA-like protease n=1 Tax=Polypedilum vanderplanki TaxID=319348 RepID=A0A9J6BYA0_POLVA|nr:hypothetical protein PVAND_004784 [Polypedilum vanderplanki]
MWKAEILSAFFFGVIIGLSFLSHYFLHRLDTDVHYISQEENHPGSFIAERAYQNLKILNDFGPKVVGSEANEIIASNYILNHLNEIKNNATNPNDIQIDQQIASGVNFVSMIYINLQNIVVRLQGETNHAVMLNCHFDSVPGSPGASDNIVNCATMIELLRVLSKNSRRQRHTIIFLFNGSEEQDLQAAHAFITQNQWRNEVRAYINLESTGSDGREILFRTGPKHDWLVRMYRESVPRPFGHSVAEELMASGVIPMMTDFEIFRDYGEIPGLDFAYIKDGWRWHTRYDSIDYLSKESIQRTGNNVLALLKKVANSDELQNPPEGTYAIYYDFLGLFFVSYTASAGAVFNYIIAVLAFVIPFIIQTKFKLKNLGFVTFETLMSFVTIVIATVLAALTCWGMANLMNVLDNTMSWYNTTFLSIGIYCSLALLIQILTYHLFQLLTNCCLKTKKYKEASKRHRVKISLNGVNLFWSVITITLTAMGFRFGYITMILLFISLCTFLLIYALSWCLSKTTSQSWVVVHLFGHSFAYLFMCYMMFQVQELFIPIAGRIFYSNPDVLVALISVFWMTITMSYFVPLTLLIKYRIVIYSVLGGCFVVCIILAFTTVGFPYSDDQTNPRLQRFRTIHLKRSEYNTNNNLIYSANNVLLYPWDRNGLRTLKNTFSSDELVFLSNDERCSDLYMCGFPHYRFDDRFLTLATHNTPPNIAPTNFTLISRSTSNGITRIEFGLQLKTLTMISITPMDGLTFRNSSIAVRSNYENGRHHFIAWFTFGINRFETLKISVDFEGTPTSNIWAKIGVVTIDSTFDQGPQEIGYKNIMERFHDYTFSYVQQADSTFYQIGS